MTNYWVKDMLAKYNDETDSRLKEKDLLKERLKSHRATGADYKEKSEGVLCDKQATPTGMVDDIPNNISTRAESSARAARRAPPVAPAGRPLEPRTHRPRAPTSHVGSTRTTSQSLDRTLNKLALRHLPVNFIKFVRFCLILFEAPVRSNTG